MVARPDPRQADLLAWEPPVLVPPVQQDLVRAGTLRGRIARGVALVLRECPKTREQIAQEMSDWLGEEVPVGSIAAYASQAREDHTISAVRLAALAHVTGDMSLLQILLEGTGYAAIEERYVDAAHEAITRARAQELRDEADRLDQRAEINHRRWGGKRP